VTSIGDGTFEKCSSLTSITIPSGVTSIGDGAFYDCSSLTSITIPSSVTSIGDCAFTYCSSLTSITIPSSVTSIGDYAFSECSSLTSINVAAANTIYKSVNGILYSKDGTKLICYPGGKSGSVTIPSSVTSIGSGAFCALTSLTGVTIPSSVTSIGDYAFVDCENLARVIIKGTVTSIGDSAFDIGSATLTLTFVVPTGKISYYQGLLNADVMGGITAVVTDKYTVTFNTKGGVAGAGSDYTQYIGIDGLASAPANPPTRTGYDFNGWYSDSACSNIWNFSADKVTKDITLYAKWTAVFGTPANLKAVPASYNSNKLTWTAVTATGYTIYRSTSPTSGFISIGTSATTSYTDTGLATGKTYYYKVKAYKTVGDTKTYSAATAAVSAKPILATPTALKAARASAASIKVTWTAVPGATGYIVYRSLVSSSGFVQIAATTTAVTYTNTGLTTGKTYYYKVKAYRTVGTTKIYSAATVTVSAKP